MPQNYDITSKELLSLRPADWAAYAGVPAEEADTLDANLPTVNVEADKVIRVLRPHPLLLHFEMQTRNDLTLPMRLLRYNVLLLEKYSLPVRSIVLLLRAEANSPSLTGNLKISFPESTPYLEFGYQGIRVYEQPVETILAGELGTLPLAPISNVAESELPLVIARMRNRITSEATPGQALKLLASTQILMGLRYSQETTERLMQGVFDMEDSATYQAILRRGMEEGRANGLQQGMQQGMQLGAPQGVRQGRLEEARNMLLLFGEGRLGTPDAAILAALNKFEDAAYFEALAKRLMQVESWAELLAK